MSNKPINFRPSEDDQDIIDLLMEHFDYKGKSDLVRNALFYLALDRFGDVEFHDFLKRKKAHRIDKEIMNDIIRKSRG